jgi:hypothetical protein
MGSADLLCFCCGGPTYSRPVITNTSLLKLHIPKKEKYYAVNPDGFWADPEGLVKFLKLPEDITSKLIKSIKTPAVHIWQNNIIMLTPTKIIKNIISNGEMFVVQKKSGECFYPPYFKNDKNDKNDYGHLMHTDCYNLLLTKYGKFDFHNIVLSEKYVACPETINYGKIKKYQGQFFYSSLAHLEYPELLESPLQNIENKKRILNINFSIKI